jgi:SAM-dependent methyltransferase
MKTEFNPPISHPAYFIKKYLYQYISKLSKELNGRLLDFGCGEKPYEELFSVTEYIGLDYNGEGETYSKQNVDVFYNGKDIPFDDNYFDSVFSTEVFEHVFNPEQIIPELHRVLKPGGKMLITCPFAFPEHEIPLDFARYSSYGVKSLFEKYGFKTLLFYKTGDYVLARAQMRSIYWNLYLLNKLQNIPVLRQIVRKLFFTISHTTAIIKSYILPKSNIYYLSNILLLQKGRV